MVRQYIHTFNYLIITFFIDNTHLNLTYFYLHFSIYLGQEIKPKPIMNFLGCALKSIDHGKILLHDNIINSTCNENLENKEFSDHKSKDIKYNKNSKDTSISKNSLKTRISKASTAVNSPNPSVLNNSSSSENLATEDLFTEISEIYKFLKDEFNVLKFNKEILEKIELSKNIDNKSNLPTILKNLQNQIISLELSQYAESVVKVEKSSNGMYRLSCHPGDKRSTIIVTKENYFRLFRYRDSSNFLFSNDKSQSHSHVVV